MKIQLDKARTIAQCGVCLCFFVYVMRCEQILNWLSAYGNKENIAYIIPTVYLVLYFALLIGRKFRWNDYLNMLAGLFVLYVNTPQPVTITYYICVALLCVGLLVAFIRS